MRKFISNLRFNAFGPRPVDAIVSDINRTVDELRRTSEAKSEEAFQLRAASLAALNQADRAATIAHRLGALVE